MNFNKINFGVELINCEYSNNRHFLQDAQFNALSSRKRHIHLYRYGRI